jgi:cytochrome c peroxidase
MTRNETLPPRASVLSRWRAAAFAGAVLTLLVGCGHTNLDIRPDADISPEHLRTMFEPIAAAADRTGVVEAREDLGRELYYDTHLSENNSISCNSCHQLTAYGVDHHATSTGHDGRLGGRNAPTVYNATFAFVQFWDGRARTLADQASGPMMNPVEMGMAGPQQVLEYVQSQPHYLQELKAAFPGDNAPATMKNITTSIAAFESGLVTPGAWDRYLNGDTSALTDEQKQGLRVFLRAGCESCHAGRALGGNSFEQLGAAHDWHDQIKDAGLAQVSKSQTDAMFFRVPILRNVAETGPYFHDGSVATLDEAVRLMARHETDEKLTDEEVKQVVTFLQALTGPLPQQYIQPPQQTAPSGSHSARLTSIPMPVLTASSQGGR